MPHAFFIGSKMATMRRLTPAEYGEDSEGNSVPIDTELPRPRRPSTSGPHLHLPQPFALGDYDLNAPRTPAPVLDADGKATKKKEPPIGKPTLACVRAHLPHAVADVAGSLLGFAILINSSILILAAAVFYYGEGRSSNENGVSDLFDAYDLVKQYLGQGGSFSRFCSSVSLTFSLDSLRLPLRHRPPHGRPVSVPHRHPQWPDRQRGVHRMAHDALEATPRHSFDWHHPQSRRRRLGRSARDRRAACWQSSSS